MKYIKLFEDFFILNEDIWGDTIKRMVLQSNVDEQIIKNYISEYKRIKEKFFSSNNFIDDIKKQTGIDPMNLGKMKFEDLEKVVDYVKSMKATKQETSIEVDGTPIYKQGDIEIYKADSKDACIKYSNGYSWCIGRRTQDNMFNSYRFKEHEPIFYFVKNLKRTKQEFGIINTIKSIADQQFKDKYHFFVIQVPFNVDITDTNKLQYIVTSAQNGDDSNMSWDSISKIEPELKNLQKMFIGESLKEAEREIYKKYKNTKITDDEFKKMTWEDKNMYMDVVLSPTTTLTDSQFFMLPDDLKKKFIGFGLGLSKIMLDYINKNSDLKKYSEKVGTMLYDKIKSFDISLDDITIRQLNILPEKIWEDSKINPSYLDDILYKSEINDALIFIIDNLDFKKIYKIDSRNFTNMYFKRNITEHTKNYILNKIGDIKELDEVVKIALFKLNIIGSLELEDEDNFYIDSEDNDINIRCDFNEVKSDILKYFDDVPFTKNKISDYIDYTIIQYYPDKEDSTKERSGKRLSYYDDWSEVMIQVDLDLNDLSESMTYLIINKFLKENNFNDISDMIDSSERIKNLFDENDVDYSKQSIYRTTNFLSKLLSNYSTDIIDNIETLFDNKHIEKCVSDWDLYKIYDNNGHFWFRIRNDIQYLAINNYVIDSICNYCDECDGRVNSILKYPKKYDIRINIREYLAKDMLSFHDLEDELKTILQ